MQAKRSLRESFNSKKPLILAFIAGLVVGPLVTGIVGWQVTAGTMTERIETAVQTQQASFCEWRARQEVTDPAAMDYSARRELARKYAPLPWQDEANYKVISACAKSLAEQMEAEQGTPKA